jgi:hypothetical protein
MTHSADCRKTACSNSYGGLQRRSNCAGAWFVVRPPEHASSGRTEKRPGRTFFDNLQQLVEPYGVNMSQTKLHPSVPVIAAACLIMMGAGSGHVYLGLACAVAAFFGLRLREYSDRKIIGNTLFLLGSVGFAVGLLFMTGYTAGKDMTEKDAARAEQSTPAQ